MVIETRICSMCLSGTDEDVLRQDGEIGELAGLDGAFEPLLEREVRVVDRLDLPALPCA